MTSVTSDQIAVIGPHPDLYFDVLHNAGHQYVNYSDFSQYKAHHKAFALIGHDASLADVKAIKDLLDSGTVISLFSPSSDVLLALKTALNCPVDVTNIELGEGVPIIVHKVNDVVHLTPGFSHLDSTSCTMVLKDDQGNEQYTPPKNLNQTSIQDISSNLMHAVKLLEKSLSVTETASPSYSNNLTPPIGTSFFSQIIVNVSAYIYTTYIPWTSTSKDWTKASDDQKQYFDFYWTVNLYCYATNHTPHPNSSFSSNGGVVYVIATHSGQVQHRSSTPRWFGPSGGNGTSECAYFLLDSLELGIEDSSGLLKTYTQLPSGQGDQNGTNINYSLNFSQTLNLFKNNGNTAFQFDASYSETYSRDCFQQTSRSSGSSRYSFSFDYKGYFDRYAEGFSTDTWWNHGVFDWSNGDYKTVKVLPDDYIPFHGMSMFSSDVGKASLNFVMPFAEAVGFKSNTAFGYGQFSWGTLSWPSWTIRSLSLDLTFDD